jgi:hypothetical protein
MGEKIVGAVRQVIGLLVARMDSEIESWRSFEGEVKSLIAPDLAELAHQRAHLLDGAGEARWSNELDRFMEQRLWPQLGEGRAYAERNRTFVTLLLDVTIAAEQRRTPAASRPALPIVAAFGTNWAN